jgi:hypothetical protein
MTNDEISSNDEIRTLVYFVIRALAFLRYWTFVLGHS